MDSHVRPQSPRLNAPTEMFLPGHRPATTAPDLRSAYTFAKEAHRLQPDDLRGQPGHRLFWFSTEHGWGSRSILASPDAFVIAGRHTCCAVLLPEDRAVSLRHLLVRSIALPTGGTAIRILDLHSEQGFRLVDGSLQTSVVAQGPVAISIGAYALVVLSSQEQLPEELPVADVTLCSAEGPYRSSGRTGHKSRITLMPRLVTLGESPPPSLGRLVRGTGYTITLEREGRSAATRLSDEDLLGGVVIGRSEKCHSESLRRITAGGTSRLHCLVLRDGDGIHAYDLASTQGTYHLGSPARRVPLGHRTELRLGQGESAVKMLWQVG